MQHIQNYTSQASEEQPINLPRSPVVATHAQPQMPSAPQKPINVSVRILNKDFKRNLFPNPPPMNTFSDAENSEVATKSSTVKYASLSDKQ